MYKCFACNIRINDLKFFRKHLRCLHQSCSVETAPKKLSNISCLIRHYDLCHLHKPSSSINNASSGDNLPIGTDRTSVDEGPSIEAQLGEEEHHNTDTVAKDNESDSIASLIENQVDLFICKLYSNHKVPRKQVQDVVDYTRCLLNDISTILKPACVKVALSSTHTDPNVCTSKIEEIFQQIDPSFQNLRNEYIRQKIYMKDETFIAPQTVCITSEVAAAARSGSHAVETTSYTADMIPLRKTLKKFLEQPGVMEKFMTHIGEVTNVEEFYVSFLNAESWMKFRQSTQDKFFLPLFLYEDEFEVENPLGAAKDIHKITGLYATMPFLPPDVFTNLKNILIVYLHHSSDRSKTNNSNLYKQVIDEFIFLHDEGILLDIQHNSSNTPPECIKIHFSLALMLGDNLGLHQMLEFSEGFTAHHPCRICMIHKSVMYTSCMEDDALRRNPQNYASQLALNNFTLTGIKEECPWNRVPNFHCTTNTGFDIMHDLLEGCCKTSLGLVLNYYHSEGYVDLFTLNERIEMFNYGIIDKASKPPKLTLDKGRLKISMSAYQMLFFSKYFGLLFADLVPERHFVWKLYIYLKNILDIVLSLMIPKDDLPRLENFIKDHHRLYLRLTPNGRLKNKHHHLTHYPFLIRQFGPPIFYWSMRFEAKHQIGESISVSIANRENITLSIALRNQFSFHSHLKSGAFMTSKLKCGPCSPCKISNVEGYPSFRDQIPPDVEDIEETSWVEISGTIFKSNMVLVTGYANELPLFSYIKSILVLESENVVFICSQLKTLYFDEHYQAYKVESEETNLQFTKHSALCHNYPTVLSNSSAGDLFVTYKYAI